MGDLYIIFRKKLDFAVLIYSILAQWFLKLKRIHVYYYGMFNFLIYATLISS